MRTFSEIKKLKTLFSLLCAHGARIMCAVMREASTQESRKNRAAVNITLSREVAAAAKRLAFRREISLSRMIERYLAKESRAAGFLKHPTSTSKKSA